MSTFINVKTKRIIINLAGIKVARLHTVAREAFILWLEAGRVFREQFSLGVFEIVPIKAVHREICGLSTVSREMFLGRNVYIDFLKLYALGYVLVCEY